MGPFMNRWMGVTCGLVSVVTSKTKVEKEGGEAAREVRDVGSHHRPLKSKKRTI